MASSRIQESQAGPRIFLVEDEELLSWCIDLELTALGFEVKLAQSLRESKELLDSSYIPDLFICDQGLPDGRGVDLIREHQDQGHRTPVIMITAFTPPSQKELDDIGACICLTKPFDLKMLTDKVQRTLQANKAPGKHTPNTVQIHSR
ncbi:MAG: response regulator [Proteobacteria bacterium]|nr:response regulator [Pseudomonadota bacterium]